jgi:hypothetical protein
MDRQTASEMTKAALVARFAPPKKPRSKSADRLR